MDYKKRLKSLQEFLSGMHCDAFLVEDKMNLLYLTGISLSAGKMLLIGKDAFLLVDNRYLERALSSSPTKVFLDTPGKFLELLDGCRSLGFDEQSVSYQRYTQLTTLLPGMKFVPLENPVKKIRRIKDREEIRILREAAQLGSRGYDFVVSQLREGITEAELAIELDIFWKRNGGKGLAFEPIIAFGPNSSMPHYQAGRVPLKKGDPVLIDIGVVVENYHSDMTRVVFFGEPFPKMQEIYRVVEEAQAAAIQQCKPGISIGDVDRAARQIIEKSGYGEMFTHSLGHGIGLEIHEEPVMRSVSPYQEMKLEPGMVITIEPGIYLSGIGGVRIEDTIAITGIGSENLTCRPTDIRIVG